MCVGADIVYTAGKKRDDVLVVLAGDDLRELWSRDSVSAGGPFAGGFTYPCALDLDADGRDEILVAENGNHLLCLSSDGELAWDVGLGKRERLNPEGVVSSKPVVADFLGDGIAELAVGCFAGAVVVMDARTGEVLDRLQFGVESHESHLTNPKIPRFIRDALRETGEPVNCLTPVELDGSPGSELVLGCSDGFVYACDPGSGDIMWKFGTRENVYDPCLLVGGAGEAARRPHGARDRRRAAGSTPARRHVRPAAVGRRGPVPARRRDGHATRGVRRRGRRRGAHGVRPVRDARAGACQGRAGGRRGDRVVARGDGAT